MDELKLNLTTNWMKGIIAKIIAKAIRKKLGCDIDILINNVSVKAADGKIQIHVDIDAETTGKDFMKLIKNVGLD